jgi:predicted thioesterase
METQDYLQPGMSRESTFQVSEEHSASHVGSGSLRVLATPWMVAYMENVSRSLLGDALPEGYSSVGVHLDIRHLAPTPVGGNVRVRAEILSVEGLKVNLEVSAWDEQEQVGSGKHQRVVIDEARFLKRVAAKIGEKSE